MKVEFQCGDTITIPEGCKACKRNIAKVPRGNRRVNYESKSKGYRRDSRCKI